MRPAAATSFDIADWFEERAGAEDCYLQPRKLQCLLFLAQGHFAVAYQRRKLMPSVFVVDHAGPMDPNIYRACEHGKPEITKSRLDQPVLVFLDAIWRQYGGLDTGTLNQTIAEFGADEPTVRDAGGDEVSIDAMCRMFAKPAPANKPVPAPASAPAYAPAKQGAPQNTQALTGRPVAVQKWIPGQKTAP
jgi:uncharacterized phage-associated protein